MLLIFSLAWKVSARLQYAEVLEMLVFYPSQLPCHLNHPAEPIATQGLLASLQLSLLDWLT